MTGVDTQENDDPGVESSGNSLQALKIGVVGPCAAGKSTLIAGLIRNGLWGKHIAQEHSLVADMWQKITKPDRLVYLNVSYETSLKRRPQNWSEAEFEEQIRRLRHARQFADLIIDTDHLTPEEVLKQVLQRLQT